MPKPLIFGHMLAHQNLSGNTLSVCNERIFFNFMDGQWTHCQL